MDFDNLIQQLQKGLHITLGATTSLFESLQDSQKRDENLRRLETDFEQLSEEWADKGRLTEQEARNFVDSLLGQRQSASNNRSRSPGTPANNGSSVTSSDIQFQLQELTAQVTALRVELETRSKTQDSDSA